MEKPAPIVVTVFGAGSFGTAMAVVAARNGHTVRILARDPAQVATINKDHRNPKRLSDFVLPDNITATTDAAEALRDTALMIHAIPVQKSPDFLGTKPRCPHGQERGTGGCEWPPARPAQCPTKPPNAPRAC